MEIRKDKIRQLLTRARRIVVKVGSSTLTHVSGQLNLQQIEQLVRELADLKHRGLEIILVTSGAQATGMGKMGLEEKPANMPQKQALAAIGQGILMHMYEKIFNTYDEIVAQVLLTREDIMHRGRYLNGRNTLLALLDMGVVPIINENDTVVVDEIKFGDNDTLAALVAGLVDADLLVLLSDIEGLYTCDPRKDPNATLIRVVDEITPQIESLAGEPGTKLGSGGMVTKITAAKIAYSYGIPVILAHGSRENILSGIANGENPGTLFLSRDHRIGSRKGWIAFASKTSGSLRVDTGAENALIQKGKSLLPSGITGVEGKFDRGSVVSVIGKRGEIARGIVNYDSQDIEKIKGCQSKEIANILGYQDDDEVIHRDNMTVVV